MSKNILVAGGAGYIGSHTVRHLAENGYSVTVYDNLSEGHAESVAGLDLVQGDIGDVPKLAQTLQERESVAVVHFAAFAYVGESVTNPEKYYFNNVTGTLALLSAMRQASVKNIVFSSTCATYGSPSVIPITEAQKQDPINPYGKSKLMVENILQDYQSAYGLNYASLRYFNAAGAHPSGDIGESHRVETHLVPLVLQSILGKQKISVFGTDYPTPDGTCIRDYIHVCDLATAHRLALEYLLGGGKSIALNLGTGRGSSVAQVISAAEKVTGKTCPVVYGERRAGDPVELVADASLAKKILGFECKILLEEMLRTAWLWEQNKLF
jgi:UDP-glucose 4-epimerase